MNLDNVVVVDDGGSDREWVVLVHLFQLFEDSEDRILLHLVHINVSFNQNLNLHST